MNAALACDDVFRRLCAAIAAEEIQDRQGNIIPESLTSTTVAGEWSARLTAHGTDASKTVFLPLTLLRVKGLPPWCRVATGTVTHIVYRP